MSGTTYKWATGTSGNWSVKNNWTPASVPATGSNVDISANSATAYTVSENVTTTIASLTIGTIAATLTMKGAHALTVTGSVTNSGTIGIGAGDAVTFGTLINSGVIDLTGGTLAGGGILNAGLIEGKGALTGAISGLGVVEAVGGTLNLGTTTTSGTQFQIANNAILNLGSANVGKSTVQFLGTKGTLDVGPGFTGTIDNLNVSKSGTVGTTVIDVLGETVTSAVLSGSTIDLFGSAGLVGTLALGNSFPAADRAVVTSDGGSGFDIFLTSEAPCFVAGTAIATPDGERLVEDLSEGDLVTVVTDARRATAPVRWIGQRWLNLNNRTETDPAAPVRVRCNAIASGVPHRDLLLSPDHCLKLDGKLVPVLMLVNDMTIVREARGSSVQYFHVELERHGIILAEGAEAETYLDTGNRAMFANAGLALLLHPDFRVEQSVRHVQDACAPLEIAPANVRPIWQSLADRAERIGYLPRQVETATEPDLHLVLADRTVEPIDHTGDRYRFILPRGTDRVVLASRATKPADIVRYLDDRRTLGVAVGSVTLTEGDNMTVYPADHLPRGTGWHAAEATADGIWCWTNGAGELRLRLLRQTAVLEIQLAGAASYIIAEIPARLAA